MYTNILDELELKNAISEFDTAIAILEYYQKQDMLSSYYMEAQVVQQQAPVQPPAAGQQPAPVQPPAAGQQPVVTTPAPAPANNSSQFPNIKPTAGATIQPPNGSGQQPKTAAEIMNGVSKKDTTKKQGLFARIFDAIRRAWAKIVAFFTGKDIEQKVNDATEVVETAKSQGMSPEEFTKAILSTTQASGTKATTSVPIGGGTGTGATVTTGPGTTATGSEYEEPVPEAEELRHFYEQWFTSGKMPTRLSKATVDAMGDLAKVLVEVAKALPNYSAHQIEVEGPQLVQLLNTKSEVLTKALNEQYLTEPEEWKQHSKRAGKLCSAMDNAFKSLQDTLMNLYKDPEKGPSVDKAFGNVTGPLKTIMNAAKMLNKEKELIEITAKDAKTSHGIFGGGKFLGSAGQSETVEERVKEYRKNLEESGKYTDVQINDLVKRAKKEFSQQYETKYKESRQEHKDAKKAAKEEKKARKQSFDNKQNRYYNTNAPDYSDLYSGDSSEEKEPEKKEGFFKKIFGGGKNKNKQDVK